MRALSARAKAALIALTLGLGVGGFMEWRSVSSEGNKGPSSESPIATTDEAVVTSKAARFVAGVERIYALDLQTATKSGRGAENKEMALSIELTGVLHAGVLGAPDKANGAKSVFVAMKLDEPRLSMGHERPDTKEMRAVEASLAAPFLVEMDGSGRVLSLRFAKGGDVLARSLLKTVVALAQRIDAPLAIAETIEEDTSGEYAAVYVRSSPSRVEKARARYLRLASGEGLVATEAVGALSGSLAATFTLDASGAETRVEARHALTIDPGQGMPVSSGVTTLTLAQTTSRAIDARAPAAFDARSEVLTTLASLEASARVEDAKIVDGKSLAELRAELGRTPKSEGGKRADMVQKLEALFRVDPSAIDDAKKAILAGEAIGTRKSLFAALGGVATPHAQAALAAIAGNARTPAAVRAEALVHLGLTKSPTAESLAALEDRTRDADSSVRRTATLALGNEGHTLRGDGREAEADEVTTHLVGQYRAAASDDERALVLRALGNTGDPAVLPIAKDALRSENALVRSAAALALRFVRGPAADAMLALVMTADSDAEVRTSAIEASSFREIEPFVEAFAKALRRDDHVDNRMRIVDALGQRAARIDGVRALLDWVRQNDAAGEVRAAAARYAG